MRVRNIQSLTAKWSLLLLLFFCGPSTSLAADVREYLEAPVDPQSGIPCPSPDQYSPIRPDPVGTPTVVGLTMMFQDISRLNDVEQTMAADVTVILRWHDPRLADPARGDGSADCVPPGRNLWMPSIEPENLRSRQAFYDPRFLVDANGTVTLARRLLVEVANPLDLHDFPFDQHQFRIRLWPTISAADEVVFHPLHQSLPISPDLTVLGWKVGSPTASVHEGKRFGREGTFSYYDVAVEMVRDWRYYAWKLGLPLLLIVMMGYGVYFLPPAATAQQVALGMTAMLTLIAYMLALGSTLPKIPYLTRADRLFVGCAIVVFLGLLKAVLTAVWVQQDAQHVIRWGDRLGRIFYPAIVLLTVMIAALL
jgi:hypothetical protein